MDATHRSDSARRMMAMAAATIAAVVAAAAASAQNVSGVVTEAGSGQPLAGAQIVLIAASGEVVNRTLSREDGRFALLAPGQGAWTVEAELFGYQSVRSAPIQVRVAEWVVVEIHLDIAAIPVDPVVVTARRAVGSPDIQRFYDRRDRASRSGIGHFVVREDIDRVSPHRPTDLLRSTPGIRVVRGPSNRGQGLRMSGGCVPAIFIDGMRINRSNIHDSLDDFVTVLDIEGVEVYRGASSQVGQYHDPSGCGLVLVWTRAGVHDPDATFKWRTVLGTLGVLGLLILLMN